MEINDMSLKDKIAQMLIVDLDAKSSEKEVCEMIKNNKIGGILLYKRNYSNYEDMIRLINKYKLANKDNKIPLFISIDQEGGRVNRLPNEIEKLKPAFKYAKTKDINIIKETGSIIGEILNKSGINLNYGPVFDIKRFPDDHAIGDRCFGENAIDAEKYASLVMKEIENKDVISVIKHFPGHGATSKDTHIFLPSISKKLLELENEDILVFKKAIKDGADAIMLGHLIVKSIDRFNPASLSRKVINYLKNECEFDGLIVTDDLKMGAIRILYRPKFAAYKALKAGNDLILVGAQTSNIDEIINYIYKKTCNNKDILSKIDESVKKILEMKTNYNITDEEVKGINIDTINKKIYKLNNKLEENKN